jgi:hypothetical protein
MLCLKHGGQPRLNAPTPCCGFADRIGWGLSLSADVYYMIVLPFRCHAAIPSPTRRNDVSERRQLVRFPIFLPDEQHICL